MSLVAFNASFIDGGNASSFSSPWDDANASWWDDPTTTSFNASSTLAPPPAAHRNDFIFDSVGVRALFLAMYTIVFCFCFFGNMVVIVVLTVSRRLRSITNFFLANLAVADLCVGVFCVYENLFLYIMAESNWIFGVVLCKMYMFMHNLCYTASILILMVMCLERYVAIIHPIACRRILTHSRLVLVVVGVWCVAAVYSFPRLAWMNVFEVHNGVFCLPNVMHYNMVAFDAVNLVVLYVVPLMVMSVLYSVIASELWHSAEELRAATVAAAAQQHVSSPTTPRSLTRQLSRRLSSRKQHKAQSGGSSVVMSSSSQHVLRARRGVVRMLIAVVVTFAVCNLPIHARKLWQHGGRAWGFRGDSSLSQALTQVTFLMTYLNSAINPLLYAFMSRNFRKGLKEVLCGPLRGRASRRWKGSKGAVGGGEGGTTGGKDLLHERQSSTSRHSAAVSVVTVHS